MSIIYFLYWLTDESIYFYDNPLDYLGPKIINNGPLAVYIGITIVLLLFIWKAYKWKWLLAAAGLAIALTAIAYSYFNNVYLEQSNLSEIYDIGRSGDEVNLADYEPFKRHTLAKSLDEEGCFCSSCA